MAEIEYLDNSRLEKLRRIGGNELVLKMIESFLKLAPERIESVIVGTQSGDFGTIEYAAHSLKSSAGNLGATKLHELTERIEYFAENRELTPIELLAKELEELFGRLTAYLREEKRKFEQ